MASTHPLTFINAVTTSHSLRSTNIQHRTNANTVRRICTSQNKGRQNAIAMRAMRFRPCIDLHQGKVKQLVGGTFRDSASSNRSTKEQTEEAEVNFESSESASYYALLYARDNLPGGHVIMIGPGNEKQAISALTAYPSGLHIGGGINDTNAMKYLSYGASHIIVTSYVFQGGEIQWDNVTRLQNLVDKSRLVLDVSCKFRKEDNKYIVCTDRWQKSTNFEVNQQNIGRLCDECDELLIHAVDNEGKKGGVDLELISNLAEWANCPITYAGGVSSLFDLDLAKDAGRGNIDITIGSALDLFGGSLRYSDAVQWQRKEEQQQINK